MARKNVKGDGHVEYEVVDFCREAGLLLNDQQLEAVASENDAILLLAVPGSGKTTVMVTRLGYAVLARGITPESILALTFTKAAAIDMRKRFASMFGADLASRIDFRTINSICETIVNEYSRTSPKPPFQLVTNTAQIVRESILAVTEEYPADYQVEEMQGAIGYAKNMLFGEEDIRKIDEVIPHFSAVYEEYHSRLRDRRLRDYDDQLIYARRILLKHPDMLAKVRRRYAHVYVDEAQDTSKIQHEIIRMLKGSSGSLFMVGDEDQSIYGFRGAYPKALTDFCRHYPKADVLKIERNYRSRMEITDPANLFIKRCSNRVDKKMVSDRGSGGSFCMAKVSSRAGQYSYLVDHVRHGGRTTAVLYRDNDCAIPLVDQLIRKGVSFGILGGPESFFNSPVVRDVEAFLALSMNHRDVESFMRVYNKCGCYISKADAEGACKRARRKGGEGDLFESLKQYYLALGKSKKVFTAESLKGKISKLKSLGPRQAIEEILECGYRDHMEKLTGGARKIETLEMLADKCSTVKEFTGRLRDIERCVVELKDQGVGDGLTLSTMHSCKGLEFDSVCIMDVVPDIIPAPREGIGSIVSEGAEDSLEEERRLFYVAMTRAKDELVVLVVQDEKSMFAVELFPALGACDQGKLADAFGGREKFAAPVKRGVLAGSTPKAKPIGPIAQKGSSGGASKAGYSTSRKTEAKRKAAKGVFDVPPEVVEALKRKSVPARDSQGTRWRVCDVCGTAKPEKMFAHLGGPDRINRGLCTACKREKCSKYGGGRW